MGNMNPIKKVANHTWTGARYWAFRSVSYASGKVPLRISYLVGSFIGDVVYLTWKQHSADAVSNMRRVLGDNAEWQVVKEVTRDSFRNYAKTLVDFLRVPHLELSEVRKAIREQEGWENLDEALSRGKGVIVVTAHFGNWDMAGVLLGSTGLPIYAVADTFEPKRLDDLVNGARERYGLRIIKVEPGSLKTIFSALRRNEIVALAFDVPEPEAGVPVQFFGETAWLPAGPAAIALKTGAAVILGYCSRRPGDRTFHGVREKPLEFQHLLNGDKDHDIQVITQQIVTGMEAVIRRYPNQWYMFRQMWPRTKRNDDEIKRRNFRINYRRGRRPAPAA